jgi:hypothetical protein
MLLPEVATILPKLREVIIRSHNKTADPRGSAQDSPEVVLEDMRTIAQFSGLREPEWQSKAALVNVYIRRYYWYDDSKFVKVGPTSMISGAES